MEGNFNYILSAVAIMKYEELYAAEWVAYHHCMGIEHFYIYDNEENSKLPTILRGFIDSGIVDLIPMYGPLKMFPAYNSALNQFRNISKYIAFFDTDEFIIPEYDSNLNEIVEILFEKNNDPGGIGINWKEYGTGNHKNRPEGLVLENYLYRGDTDQDRHIKSIINPRKAHNFMNPHFVNYNAGEFCVSQNGERISQAFYEGKNDSPLRINHYHFKSEEEFQMRIKRGKADINISEKGLQDLLDKEMSRTDEFNTIYDDLALQYVPKVKEELKRYSA